MSNDPERYGRQDRYQRAGGRGEAPPRGAHSGMPPAEAQSTAAQSSSKGSQSASMPPASTASPSSQPSSAPATQSGMTQPRSGMQPTSTTEEYHLPRADVMETDDSYIVEIEMPGFEQDDISVFADENHLIVSGERSVDTEKDHRIVQHERPYQLERTIELPIAVDVEETTASYDAGVCTIEVPKGEAEERKRIGFQ